MKIVRFSADFRFFILAETQISGFYFINSEKTREKNRKMYDIAQDQ